MASLRLARFCLCLAVFLAHGSRHYARAQYQQDYINTPQNGKDVYFYQPTFTSVPREVIDIGPDDLVVLAYNCYYMRDICKNANNFQQTTRGKDLHPRSKIPDGQFAYDLENNIRIGKRRQRSCPGSWKDRHPCPETDQRVPMRHDGPWFTDQLEPGTRRNVLKNHRTATGAIDIYSKIRYTCDEFPPASWVEGGDGEDADQPAQTRCAAMRCQSGSKAEQDWQATSHGALRKALVDIVNDRQKASPGTMPSFSETESVVFFKFYMYNTADSVAARVMMYKDKPAALTFVEQVEINQGFTRRDENAAGNATADRTHSKGLWDLTYEELLDRIDAGVGVATEYTVAVNHSSVDWRASVPMMRLMPMEMQTLDKNFRWNAEDGVEDDVEDDVGDNDNIWSNLSHRHIGSAPPKTPFANARHQPRAPLAPLAKLATAQDLARAQTLVNQAVAESARQNGARLARPLRNVYGLRPGTVLGNSHTAGATTPTVNDGVTPLPHITDEIADAAALVAEAEAHAVAVAVAGNTTRRRAPAAPAVGTYWMQGLTRKGTVPWGNNASYVVFRNVLDYGAVGNGVTDDTKAIKNAMTSGGRCGEKCNGSTTKNAIVYFPPGRYLISSTVPMPFGTQVIGDANNRPTLVASGRFVGLGVLSTDEYTGGDGGSQEYYVNTANFYRQIRNIAIDITGAGANISCLHYQVAQATSLQNVELIASADAAKNQIGMFAENGSGGQISDVTFTGGNIGLYGGNQQFTAQRLVFRGCRIGVHVIWDWGWVWKSVTMSNVDVGFRLVSADNSGNIGSVSVMDSSFQNVRTAALVIAPPSEAVGSGSTGVVLENVALSSVATAVADTAGKVYLDGSAAVVRSWVLGPTYEGTATARGSSRGGPVGDHRRHADLLDVSGAYFERAKPQYEDKSVADFIHIKDMGVTGDGLTDDTAAFQAAVYASLGRILFIDSGSYILTSTVVIPPGAKIVGEAWSQLVASGAHFTDASKPQVLIQVGQVGSIGSVEMQDLLFTTRGPTAGLILIEWNIQAVTAGSAALWDCHARIGGATGTQLTPAECPASTSGTDAGCSAASLLMRLTSRASGYFENMWLWGADHMIDDPDLSDAENDMTQCSIYIARGFLIESTRPTWLYATASEHSVFYQYNFHRAANIFAGMLQTESPYFQPTPPPPTPFAAVVGNFPGDPNYKCTAGDAFGGCDESWSTIITGSRDIFIAGAGLYSWFSTYAQTCIDTHQCQHALVRLDGNLANVRIQNLITIGAQYMAVMDGQGIAAAANLNVKVHPFWSLITVLDGGSNGTTDFSELVWIDPTIWDMPRPSFTCVPPCHVQLPPYTGATRTVNYPLLAVSSGTWTSTITQPPITISEWVLEVVTIAAVGGSSSRSSSSNNRNAKRTLQGFAPFRPVPATTPFWPAIAYTGKDGQRSTTAPSQAFPSPPPGIVQRDVVPYQGPLNYPGVGQCDFFDFDCIIPPWMYRPGEGPGAGGSDPGDDGDDENADELKTKCPPTIKVTPTVVSGGGSSSSSTSTATSSSPAPSPLETGDATKNAVSCYNSGETTENVRMQNAASSFCAAIAQDALGPSYARSMDFPFPYNGGVGSVTIVISLTIKANCTWTWNMNDCQRYLGIPTNSCNCGGVNGKQGGIVSNNCYSWRIDPNRSFS